MMLVQVEISDFALIDQAMLVPGMGLTVLTGETGAGKSILIDAISVLCGSRASRDMIRYGKDKAVIEALFEGDSTCLPEKLLTELGLKETDLSETQKNNETDTADEQPAGEPDQLILTREIQASGRTVCRLNGRLIPLSLLRELSSCLIDIHGQHDQQAIFKSEMHLQLLDRFGGAAVIKAKRPYQETLRAWRQCRRDMAQLGEDPAQRERTLDMLRYQVQEIEAANIKPREDEHLSERRRLLANAEKIIKALSEAYDLLTEDQPVSVLTAMGLISEKTGLAARHIHDLEETAQQVEEGLIVMQSAADDIRGHLSGLEMDPGELDQLDERLDLLYRLKQKHGGSLEAVLSFFDRAKQQLESLDAGEAAYEKLLQRRRQLEDRLWEQGSELTQARRKQADQLEAAIAAQLKDLGMPNIRFAVTFQPHAIDQNQQAAGKPSFKAQGMDDVAFEFSANTGEPLKPLSKIASGGEASRIMLAIKVILAQADQIPVLIFDEIDSGVSGHTADQVAEKLMKLSRQRQVFCITHLAQIAAMADAHLFVMKSAADNRTYSTLTVLDEQQRSEELGRLLSGGTGQKEARQLAERMLRQASSVRQDALP